MIAQIVVFFWVAAIFTRLGAMVISPWFIRILSIPREILLPVAASLCVLGAWASGFSRFDVVAMFGFGLVGYLLRRRGFPLAPMVLGILVGGLADVHLRRTLLSYSENPIQILTRPIGLVLLALLLFFVITQFRAMRKKKD